MSSGGRNLLIAGSLCTAAALAAALLLYRRSRDRWRVSALYLYPIKSCRGIPVESLRLSRRGPLLDRLFMLVDGNNKFVR